MIKVKQLLIILFLLIPTCALGLDLTADNCTTAEIEADAASIVAAGSGTLTLPACTGEAGRQQGEIDITVNNSATLKIVGQGPTSTVLLSSAINAIIFDITGGIDPDVTGSVTISNIGLT